jgi:hypothetical protein
MSVSELLEYGRKRHDLSTIGEKEDKIKQIIEAMKEQRRSPEEEGGSSRNALHLIIIHNYDFQRTFGEKLLKYIAILAPYISFFRRYVFTCLVQKLLFSYVNYVLYLCLIRVSGHAAKVVFKKCRSYIHFFEGKLK